MGLIYCMVLAGPIAISATESAIDGDYIELPQGDFDQLSRWGIVRKATEAEEAADRAAKAAKVPLALPAEGEPDGESGELVEPKETATQKKKRLAEEAETARIAEEEAFKANQTQAEPAN